MTRVFIALLLLLSQVAGAQSYWTLPAEVRGNSEFTGNITVPATGLLFKTNGTLIKSGAGTLSFAAAGASTITVPTATDTMALLGTAQTFTAAQSFSTTVNIGGAATAAGILRIRQSDETANGGILLVRPADAGTSFKASIDSSDNLQLWRGGTSFASVTNVGAVTWSSSHVWATGNANASITVGGNAGYSGFTSYAVGGSGKLIIGASGATNDLITGSASGDGIIRVASGGTLRVSLNGGSSSAATLTSTAATINVPVTGSSSFTSTYTSNVGDLSHFAFKRNTTASVGQLYSNTTTAFLSAGTGFALGFEANNAGVGGVATTGAWTLGPTTGAPDLTHTLRSGTTSIATFAYNAATINVPTYINANGLKFKGTAASGFYEANVGILQTATSETSIVAVGPDTSTRGTFAVYGVRSDSTGPEKYLGIGNTGTVTLGSTAGAAATHQIYAGGNGLGTNGVIIRPGSALTTNGDEAYIAVYGRTTAGDFLGGSYKHSGITSATGYMRLRSNDNVATYFWMDDSDQFRLSPTQTHIGTTSGEAVGTQTSDERLKKNIRTTSYGLSTILALDPIEFDKDGKHYTGFGAQRTQPILPEAVYDTDIQSFGEGEPTQLGMDYTQIIAPLVKAIQELSVKLDAAEARVNCLANADTKEQRLACF